MRQLFTIAFFLIMCGFDDATHQQSGEPLSLLIHIVDKDNRPFKVETVRWWPTDNVGTVRSLQCTNSPCSEWKINEEISEAITIHAARSIVKKDDESCWDMYVGDAAIGMPATEVTITVKYKNQVCK